MKNYALTLVALVGCGAVFAAPTQHPKSPVDYVSPNIGGIGQLLTATIPYVQYPHGMARLAPITTPGIVDRYLADKIYGFPAGTAVLMASTGPVGTGAEAYASDFDHDFEISTPYYYEADLQTWGIKAELTPTREAAYYRFTFPASAHSHLALTLRDNAEISVSGNRVVQGDEPVGRENRRHPGAKEKTREYFYAEFSRPFDAYQTWQNGNLSQDAKQSGDAIGFVANYATTANQPIEVRVGISYISVEQAHRNLQREIPDWNFEQVKSQARNVWNQALGAVTTVGGTGQQRTIFYTALYRSMGRMTDITEDGKYWSGYDNAVHNADGHDFYVDDGMWDTFRSLHPLQLLLNANRQEDMIRSYIRMYQQSGWLPTFPSVGRRPGR